MIPTTGQMNSPSRKRSRRDPNDYKIACFCVLDVEVAVLRGMLDEIHDDLPMKRGQNVYILGQLGGHNVVIAILPRPGNNDSGVVAAKLRSDFPSIQHGLLIGVGGGVPGVDNINDIRLGDVVVGAVIQFDRGKHHDDNKFETTGYVNKTPSLLSAAVKKLKAQHLQEGNQILPLLQDMVRRHPDMRDEYSCPGSQQDQLFETSYKHICGKTCEQCDQNKLVARSVRSTAQPHVHYGTIGSSSSVIRTAQKRDRLARMHNVLCVEMEAAALLDQLPCLVVRGICDYSDGHKNKQWQPYAAAAAAAYSKELLRAIPPEDLNQQISSHNIADLPNRSIMDTDHSALPRGDLPWVDSKSSGLIESLTFRRMDARLRNVSAALPRTCQWLTSHPTIGEWNDVDKVNQHHGFLWIKGKPGSGKSTLMKTLLTQAKRKKSRQTIISYFFNARASGKLEKSSLGLYRSLLHQLLTAFPALKPYFIEQFRSKDRNGVIDEWSANELKDFFIEVISDHLSGPLLILVDALDEGDKDDIRHLISFLEDLGSTALQFDKNLKICLSSRHFPFISIRHSVDLILENESGHCHDIREYVQQKLADDGSSTMEELRDTICQKSANIFLWIVLVIPILNEAYGEGNELTVGSMLSCLEGIPEELDGLFMRILAPALGGYVDCLITLQWVLFSQVPLKPIELYTGVSLVSTSSKFKANDASPERIRRCLLNASRGLVEFTNDLLPTMQFIHETVREFLIKGGLAQIDSRLSDNPEGLSNERLAHCCFDYIENCEGLPVGPQTENDPGVRRLEILSKNPLLEYATKFMFRHADVAEEYNVPQRGFLAQFTHAGKQKWISAWDIMELTKINQLSTDAPLLYIMAEQGHGRLLRVLLKGGHRDQESNERYGSALQAACAKQHEPEARDLIAYKSHDNLGGGQHRHALFAAIRCQSLTLVDLLLRNGCKPSIDEIRFQMAKCVSDGNLMGVKLLLDLGCPVDYRRTPGRRTPLIQACSLRATKRMVDVVRLLLDAGAEVNAHGGHFGNALQVASYNDSLEVIQMLLDAGADVNAQGGYYGNALQTALISSDIDVVLWLLSAGAKINAQGGHYGNALQAASRRSESDMVNFLLRLGADVNAEGGYYGNALLAASRHGHPETVQLLLGAGADVSAQGGDYGNALYAASRRGHLEIARLLLRAGADVNAQSGEYGNALQAASTNDAPQLVQLLLDAGADVNMQGGYYGNAIQAASYHSHLDVVRSLLEAGADVNARGGEYESALKAAREAASNLKSHPRDFRRRGERGKCNRVVQILLDHGAHDSASS